MSDDTQMPKVGRADLESKALAAAKKALGCGHLTSVTIRAIPNPGTGRDWEVATFSPALPDAAERFAREAVDEVRGKFSLDPSQP